MEKSRTKETGEGEERSGIETGLRGLDQSAAA